ncbi:Molybdate-anion transporter, Major facilitator superfamily domain protein [Thalictrum thalictroides]|uniref:Molybdate-anion transporter n=1 Tax=Thalictrum thalictroides TaxID=46969 RepID=A0A7J6WRG2_THATH|nr:Molybdate-anion transporter, Major facilitator superfamily domain protein [Thalictrum thalictroides]
MYTFVFLWTPALSPNNEEIPHGFIFATFMLSSMLGSSLASRLLARATFKVESYMQIVFAVSAGTFLLPIITSYIVPPSKVKGGGITFAGCIQVLGFCTFEACVGLFWPSIMKMRSQYIPEEARSTIMNFFRIPLNIFVCIVLYNVNAFPITVMFGMCSIFLFMASILQRRLMVVAESHRTKSQEWTSMKERETEEEPLNI